MPCWHDKYILQLKCIHLQRRALLGLKFIKNDLWIFSGTFFHKKKSFCSECFETNVKNIQKLHISYNESGAEWMWLVLVNETCTAVAVYSHQRWLASSKPQSSQCRHGYQRERECDAGARSGGAGGVSGLCQNWIFSYIDYRYIISG